MLISLALAVPAEAAPDRAVTVSSGAPAQWDGPAQAGSNGQTDGQPCGKNPSNYCDQTLVNVGSPSGDATLKIDIGGYSTPVDDFDLVVYKSDASGGQGEKVGSSGNPASQAESVTVPHATGYYLVSVTYFQTTGSYHGTATLSVAAPAPPIPDVDNPPGVDSALASNPDLGIRSHSEPHIAQSPTNPNILIAGSKQYNRDPDSLKEYEFKIGTYVSFDRGRSWRDLGQMDVCPISDAPPASWPDNKCYPADDPTAGGTGPEDASDPRGHTDRGEEYITSDIWMSFDDEGNAYAMVLDSPDFADEAGWGMTLHKWDTPSPADISAGHTWSDKVPINEYPQEKGNTGKGANGTDNSDNGSNPLGFLDDKNTFAVNNAGPDGDGKTGTILACWGQNVATLVKQQTVCKRSTDGGKSFPGQPVPVSGEQQLVLGVNVVADRKDPNTFYTVWKSYASSVASGLIFGSVGEGGEEDDLGTGIGTRPVIIYESKTTDGGQTFSPAVPIANYDELASPLPGSRFRTGAIPIGAQAPDGTLYFVYDAYNDAPAPGDSDGKTADAMLIRSTDGGMTWSSPVKVNQDGGNADQFQAHVAVADDGQLSVSFFDRRHDPANVYVDEYLARSSDQGVKFTETRLSHDMSDPSINPPISGSGEFFGDYQGLVADHCQSLAFYQDTHLANDASRDPDFDQGSPRSQFQEVMAYRAARPGATDPLCAAPKGNEGSAPFLNPGGAPGSTVCLASPPRSSISRGALRASRRALRLSGRAIDLECLKKRTRGRVSRVEVAVSIKAGKRCRFLQKSGRVSRARSCRKPTYLRAKLGRVRSGKVPWAFRHKARLRAGRYLVQVRARDTRGNIEKLKRRYNRKTVRVR